jgi:single-strand DNA-binding protein
MAVNKVILVGNLGKDPELIKVSSGTSLCKFSIATTERFKNRQGEQQEKTEWHNIIAWGGLAETCGKWLHKGKQVYIEGKLQTTSYEDDNGTRRYRTEVVANTMQMLGRVSESSGTYNPTSQTEGLNKGDPDSWDKDDIPF